MEEVGYTLVITIAYIRKPAETSNSYPLTAGIIPGSFVLMDSSERNYLPTPLWFLRLPRVVPTGVVSAALSVQPP